MKCPHCGHKLTPHEIGTLFAQLGGSVTSGKKAMAAVTNGQKAAWYNAKLTHEDAEKIRKSKATKKELARKFNVSYSTVWRVINNKNWKQP